MAVIQAGSNGAVIAEVDATAKAMRVVQRPLISATLGEYSIGQRGSNAAATAAGAAMWTFRYTGGSNLCIVDKVVLDGVGVTTALTAGQAVAFGLFVARSYTVSATGGSPATLTGNNGKLRTSYATTAVADIRIGNAGNVTAGTRTLDAQPCGSVVGGLSAVGTMMQEAALYDAYSTGHPIILANNEGLELQNLIAFPAAGVINYGVTIHWAEVTSAEWG